MKITPIYVVWIVSSLVQLGTLLRMWWIRSEMEFPLFFSYILFQTAQFPCAFLIYRRSISVPGNFYFNFYLQAEFLSVALGLACAYEVFSRILDDYQAVSPLKTSLFRWAGILLLIMGFVVALKLPNGGSGRELELLLQLDRTSRIVQAGLLFCVLCFSSYLGMNWKKPVFGIALGFGSYATVKLVVLTLALQFGATVNTFVNLVNVIGLPRGFRDLVKLLLRS